MLEYLQKYNQLPQSLRDALATPSALAAINNLESKYQVNLALVVMKAAIGDFTPANLIDGLIEDCRLSADRARQLASDLRQSLFFVLPDFKSTPPTVTPARPIAPAISSPAPAAVKPSDLSIDARVDDVIKKAKIDLASQALVTRLKQIMRTYLLGVRDRLAANDALMKPIELGGLAFSSDLADNLLKLADGKVSPASPNTRPSLPTSLDSRPTDGYDLLSSLKASGKAVTETNPLAQQSRLASAPRPLPAKALPANLPWDQASSDSQARGAKSAIAPATPVKSSPIIKLPATPAVSSVAPAKTSAATSFTKAAPVLSPAPSKVEGSAPVTPAKPLAKVITAPPAPQTPPVMPQATPTKVISTPTKVVAPPTPQTPVTVIPAPTPAKPVEPQYAKTESGAVKMDDIQFTPRVFTPIDELRYMTLKNFRNLSANPSEATALIKKKLDSLAKDDFSWKLEGISAWKQSPVNKMYVDIYHRALSQGKQIPQIITDSLASDPQAMSAPEFEAIFAFNQEVSLIK